MLSQRFRDSIAAVRCVLSHAKPPLGWTLASMACFLAVASLGVFPPLFTANIVDALQRRDVAVAFHALAAYVAVSLLFAVAQFASSYATGCLRETLVVNLRVALMAKLRSASFAELTTLTLGEIANRIANDIEMLCNQLEYCTVPLIQGVVSIVAVAIAMLTQNVELSLVSFGLVALVLVPIRLVTPKLSAQQKRISAMRDDLCGTINETANLSALALLRNQSAAKREGARLLDLVWRTRAARLKQMVTAEWASLATTGLSLLGPIAILGIGATLLVEHKLQSLGIIIAFLMFYARLAAPFGSMSGLSLQVSAIGVVAHRLMDIFNLDDEVSGDAGFELDVLALRAVSVVRGGRTLLDDVDLRVERGCHAAIVGPSGSGKSTLATLIPRLYDATAGDVTIGGERIGDLRLESLRESVALVSQDPLIFDTSLLENLTYTRPDAPLGDVLYAIEIAGLEDVVARLSDGLDTRLGQRGFRLSGGERQRICVARALVQRPDVLVLDEALTGVDVEHEMQILRAIRSFMKGRTMIVITHRIGSVAEFDPIFVMERGRIRARGSHEDLRAGDAWYRAVTDSARVYAEA
jgi:ATP-binding cassette, subfamily B, bacterial